MKVRTYAARAAALALILSPALVVAAAPSNDSGTRACTCAGPSTATPAPAQRNAATTPEPSEEVKRIWTSP